METSRKKPYFAASIHQGINRSFLMLSAGFILIAAFGCSTDANDDDRAPNEVIMHAASFSPQNLEVAVGTRVVWLNESDVMHTVTSGQNGNHDGRFDSGEVQPGGEFSYTFNETGEFPYYCIPHLQMGMTGVIHVTASGNENGGNDNDDDNDDNGDNGNGY